jgi:hypothetical protein
VNILQVSGGESQVKSQGCRVMRTRSRYEQKVQIVRSYGCIGQYSTVRYSTVQYVYISK